MPRLRYGRARSGGIHIRGAARMRHDVVCSPAHIPNVLLAAQCAFLRGQKGTWQPADVVRVAHVCEGDGVGAPDTRSARNWGLRTVRPQGHKYCKNSLSKKPKRNLPLQSCSSSMACKVLCDPSHSGAPCNSDSSHKQDLMQPPS